MPLTAATNPRWTRLKSGSVHAFHAYAGWLVGISWKLFFLLSLLLMITAGILRDLPPFSWTISETQTQVRPRHPTLKLQRPSGPASAAHYRISIDEHGIVIAPASEAASAAAAGPARPAAASTAGPPPSAPAPGAESASGPRIDIRLPPGVDSEAVRAAVEEARSAIAQAVEDARSDARAEARAEAQADADPEEEIRSHVIRLGEALPQFAFLWILASAIIKVTYKRQIQAEVQAAQAVENAEAEALRRQVIEARMAAMQAQVEPHFLFNTLASIAHLIETDPPRASVMQKNLIALLRASMPTLREASDGGVRELGREIEVIRPYLEILKIRMEERLSTTIDAPAGLMSAEFPPMMLQTLVENAIKHGLEPKAEGGALRVVCEVVHGKLAVSVADSGVGLAAGGASGAETAGTGVGLANIRERLRLLYADRGGLKVAGNAEGGVTATITIPYRAIESGPAQAASPSNGAGG